MAIFNEANVTFKEYENVYNVVNGAVLLEKVEKEIHIHDAGVKMYETFIDEGIKITESIWDNMSKRNLKAFTILSKETKVKIKYQVITLKETCTFMSRLIIVSRKREEIYFSIYLQKL